MPTFTHGKNAVVLLDNTNLSTTLTDAALSLTADVAETSTFSGGISAGKTYVAGLKDGTVTLSGYFESTDPDADAEFFISARRIWGSILNCTYRIYQRECCIFWKHNSNFL